jgi:DNA invertase Pin-like site-specific DNA recombinase
MNMKVIGIIRVSTRKQLNGNSLSDQETQIRKYAEKLNAELIDFVRVQVSGSKMKLNAGVLMQTLADARERGCSLMVSALDRLSRDAATLHLLRQQAQEAGVDVFVAGLEQSIGKMDAISFGFLSSACEWERSKIRERTQLATKKRSEGFGFGIADGNKAREASLMKRRQIADDWRKQIRLKEEIRDAVQLLRKPTLARIATIMNGKGLVTIRGSKWTPAHLTHQLRAMNIKSWQEV